MRGRRTEVAEGLDDMREDARDPAVAPASIDDEVRRRAKHGAQTILPGPSLGITLWVMKKQVTQIDWLAAEIRSGAGLWITRSAIVTAMIEAALRSETRGDLLKASHERSLRAHLLNRPRPLQQEERRVRAGKRVLQMAKYLRLKQKRHL